MIGSGNFFGDFDWTIVWFVRALDVVFLCYISWMILEIAVWIIIAEYFHNCGPGNQLSWLFFGNILIFGLAAGLFWEILRLPHLTAIVFGMALMYCIYLWNVPETAKSQ